MNYTKMKTRFTKGLQGVFLIGLAALVAVSCNDVNFSGPQNTGKAQMNVHLTDAPGDYDEVNIDVQGLRIHYTPASDTAADGQWIDLPVEPTRVNLLDFTNGIDTLLSSAELDPGHYRELRLILGSDNDVVVDSMSHNLKVPSGQQSGYKIKFSTDLEAGEELDVVVDFDAARSVHKAGNSGKYILKPVLKAFIDDAEEAETGSVIGTVEPTDADATVYAIMDQDTSGSTQPNEEGDFTLSGLDAGMYDISINAANEQYNDTTLTGIDVMEGEETDVGVVTLSEAGS